MAHAIDYRKLQLSPQTFADAPARKAPKPKAVRSESLRVRMPGGVRDDDWCVRMPGGVRDADWCV
eukprot:7940439-Pyramimonas_sp.AAC.2